MEGPEVESASTAIALEDAEWIEQCRQGDTSAFGRLVLKYQDRVFNTCWRMCGNRADAEDLTQEAFFRALRSIGAFGGRSKFYTWVFRIAVNLAISARRKSSRAAHRSLDQSQAVGGNPATSMREQLASRGSSPDELYLDREREEIVQRALEELDEDHRSVVILRELESFDYGEIAEILDIPPGTVKSRLHRARLALREKLSGILGSK
jgi:RNA polymerase sigma-70 factor (ECF subfamily)